MNSLSSCSHGERVGVRGRPAAMPNSPIGSVPLVACCSVLRTQPIPPSGLTEPLAAAPTSDVAYGDIYLELGEPFRQQGFGSYLVQQLKQQCYSLGAIPAPRCSPTNLSSRRTLQRASLTPFAHILIGSNAYFRLIGRTRDDRQVRDI